MSVVATTEDVLRSVSILWGHFSVSVLLDTHWMEKAGPAMVRRL